MEETMNFFAFLMTILMGALVGVVVSYTFHIVATLFNRRRHRQVWRSIESRWDL